jgi:2-oxo-4-hydroxy-4-carboxy-5-ureidoimidazoline decarboxylase
MASGTARYKIMMSFLVVWVLLVLQSFALAQECVSLDGKCLTAADSSHDKQVSIHELISMSPAEIVDKVGGVYEHSPWVAEELVKDAGFSSLETITDLAAAMKSIVDNASYERKLELLNAHPDLCEKVDKLKELTKESQEEQSRSGLQSLTDDARESFLQENTSYREKFRFPFIVAVRNASKYTVLAALAGRISNPVEKEFSIAMEQVHKIAWMRLLSLINTDNAKGFLTCHVLDTTNGIGAHKMRIHLHKLSPPETAGFIGEFITNDEGRLEGGPALKGGKEFTVGVYEWTLFVGDYFASQGTFTSGTPFLDTIPLRFGIDNPDDHYHVPLLVSPWSFSTYRGS